MIKVNKLYIIIYISLFVTAIINGGILFYYVFYSMTFLLAAAIFYVLIIGKLLQVDTLVKTEVSSVGDTAVCRIIVKLCVDIPIPYIEVKSDNWEIYNDDYKGKLVSVPYDESVWIDCMLHFDKRGVYDPAKVLVTYYDLFKIITIVKKYDSGKAIKVYPGVFEIKWLSYLKKDIFTEEKKGNNFKENLYSVNDLRAYREGDSLRSIHWKVSAKVSELYVKNNEKVNGEGAVVLVDFDKNNYTNGREENICDGFLSVVYYLVNNGVRTESYINCCDPLYFMLKNKDDFYSLIEYMVNKTSDGEASFAEYLQIISNKFPKHSELIIVTGIIDKSLCNILAYYNKIGYKLTVIYCFDDSLFKENLMYLDDLGIYTLDIYSIIKNKIEWWG